jgi:hypothetical protein
MVEDNRHRGLIVPLICKEACNTKNDAKHYGKNGHGNHKTPCDALPPQESVLKVPVTDNRFVFLPPLVGQNFLFVFLLLE